MQEIWKDIEGFEGLYQVSNLGRVKALKRSFVIGNGGIVKHEENILKERKYKSGYCYVGLYKNGKEKKFKIHRLVAQAFIPNPENKPEIDHVNTVRDDNRVENLRWCTRKENFANPITHERRKINIEILHSLKYKPVLQYSKEGILVARYDSATHAARLNGFSQQNISHCCLGKRKSASGFIWCFAEDVSFIERHLQLLQSPSYLQASRRTFALFSLMNAQRPLTPSQA